MTLTISSEHAVVSGLYCYIYACRLENNPPPPSPVQCHLDPSDHRKREWGGWAECLTMTNSVRLQKSTALRCNPHHSPRTTWGHHRDTTGTHSTGFQRKLQLPSGAGGAAGGCTAVLTSLADTPPHTSRILAHDFTAFIIPAARLEVLGKEPVFLIISFIPHSFLSRAGL